MVIIIALAAAGGFVQELAQKRAGEGNSGGGAGGDNSGGGISGGYNGK